MYIGGIFQILNARLTLEEAWEGLVRSRMREFVDGVANTSMMGTFSHQKCP